MSTLDTRDQRNVDELYESLKNFEAQQNKVQLSEFYQFSDLFSKSNKDLSQDYIKELSKRFFIRFNVYSPIEVYDGVNLLFKVPQLFVPLNDVSSDYENLVNNFRTYGVSDIPKYAAEATAGLFAAILKSQEDVTNQGFESYGEYIKSLSNEYQSNIEAFNRLKQNNDLNVDVDVSKAVENDSKFDINVTGIAWD